MRKKIIYVYSNKLTKLKTFCLIVSNLANNFLNTPFKSFSTYLNKRVSFIFLNVLNPTEKINAIYSLKNKAAGHDDIAAFFRIASSVIIQVFIKFCFTEGAFPENCTIARVVPIFKDNVINLQTIALFLFFLVSLKSLNDFYTSV